MTRPCGQSIVAPRRRRVLAIWLLVAATFGGSAGTVQGRGEIGPYYGAIVLCNPYENAITISPRAGANAAFDAQWIYYKISVYQLGLGWRTDLQPPMVGMFKHQRVTYGESYGWGTIPSYTTDVTDAGWTTRPGEGQYQILTQYWFWDGSAWTGPFGALTTWMNYTNSLAPHSTDTCELTLV